MGYFSKTGKWQYSNPSSPKLNTWAPGTDAYRWVHSLGGIDDVKGRDIGWAGGNVLDKKTFRFGEAGSNLMDNRHTIGSIYKTRDRWKHGGGSGGDEFIGFTPAGDRMLGHVASGWDSNVKGDSAAWTAAETRAKQFMDSGDFASYLGPSLTGGATKDVEDFVTRKNRLEGMKGSVWDPENKTGRQQTFKGNRYGTSSSDLGYDRFSTTGRGGDGFKLSPLYTAGQTGLKTLLASEFGKSNPAMSGIKPFTTSDEYGNIQQRDVDRATAFGNLYAKDNTASGWESTGGQLKGLIDYLKPSADGTSNVFNLEYAGGDDPDTPWDDTQMVDWDKTLGGETFKDKYTDAIQQYYLNKGRDVGSDPSRWGSVLKNYLDTSLPDFEGVMTKQDELKGMYQNIAGIESDIGDEQSSQRQADVETRGGLLDQFKAAEQRKYLGGFAGMGESPALAMEKGNLLSDAGLGLLGTKNRVGALRGDIDTELQNISTAETVNQNFLDNIYGSWSDLETDINEQSAGFGEWSRPEGDWLTDLWSSVESGLPKG